MALEKQRMYRKNIDGTKDLIYRETSSDLVKHGDIDLNTKINNIDSSLAEMTQQLDEVFTSVSNGKTLIASAITDKGVTTSNTDSFQAMATNISSISQVLPSYGELVVSDTTISVNEGGNNSFTVKLASEPTVNQTVNLYRNNEDVTLDKSVLIFTPSNWNVVQTVNITVGHDEDYDGETCIITLSSKSVENKTITINITDDDVPTINVQSVKLNKNIFTMSVHDVDTLTATITPSDATNKNVTWNASNGNCTLVPNGLSCSITGVTEGQCTITVTTEDGSKTDICNYTVEVIQENTLDIRYFQLERQANQLVMPTNICAVDTVNIGSHNDVVHPSALYFKDGWNGYKYWMAITPYPKTNSAFENPCMIVSNDGDNWSTSGNIPIYPIMSGAIHNSDCHIFMDGNTMYYLNRGATDVSCMIEYFTSTDGANWSARTTIIEAGGHNYLSPSVCKYNSKYYMFVYDHALTGTEDNNKRITVLESTTINGTWTKVNTILCPNVTTIWHLEVKVIDGGFIGLIMTGDSNGGSLSLVKFDTPMNTEVTDYIINPIVSARNILNVESSIYKSTIVKKDNDTLELFINSKGKQTLDAFCHWTLNKAKLIKEPIADTNKGFTVQRAVETYKDDGNFRISALEYYNYEVEFKVKDLVNTVVLLKCINVNPTTDYYSINFESNSIEFRVNHRGNVIYKVPIIFKITENTIFKFISLNNIIYFYANDRKIVEVDENYLKSIGNQSTPLNLVKRMFGCDHTKSLIDLNLNYLLTETEAINVFSSETLLNNEVENFSSNPTQYYVFDDFNRTNGVLTTTTNGLTYTTDSTMPQIQNNTLVNVNGDNRALLEIGGNDYIIYADLRPSFNGHILYLRYVDNNNYVALCFGGNDGFNIQTCIAGTKTNKQYDIWNTNTVKYIVIATIQNNKVTLNVNNQDILKSYDMSAISSTKVGFGAGLANCKMDTFIVKKIL